jgi:phage terminase Nu1 subunit (DNA packaging protein)
VIPNGRGLPVSKKQCCDIVSWTAHQFDKAVRDGMKVAEHPTGRGTDYVVFMGDVIRWIVEQELRAAGHEPSEVVKLDLNAERARLAKEQADKTAMDNALARGELVRVSDVEKADEVVYTTLRDRIMSVRSESPRIRDAAIKDGVPGVRQILEEALSDALMGIGKAGFAGLKRSADLAA